jgi:hypothetical protein
LTVVAVVIRTRRNRDSPTTNPRPSDHSHVYDPTPMGITSKSAYRTATIVPSAVDV